MRTSPLRLFLVSLLFLSLECLAQKKIYTTANAHSHNDYEQGIPFYQAWKQGFGSIEADIFLYKGKLIVAHDSSQLTWEQSLDSLYLFPLQRCIEKNEGSVYADKNRSIQLMIDIKSEAVSTLNKLIETLKTYPVLARTSTLKIVISGNRPPPANFESYPAWIQFDGELQRGYKLKELEKIEMFSDNFARYSLWKGQGVIPEKDSLSLKQWVDKAHLLGKKIRFWNAPDNPESWKVFMGLGVDYINTDNIDGLSRFLQQ